MTPAQSKFWTHEYGTHWWPRSNNPLADEQVGHMLMFLTPLQFAIFDLMELERCSWGQAEMMLENEFMRVRDENDN